MTSKTMAVPPGFLWGVSTSSFQIEGATQEDGRGPSVWDKICREKGAVANGDTADVACDHYHRYAEDIALMRGLGVPAYRFSVAWPRLLPLGKGPVNAKGLDFYDRMIDGLLAAGIEPWLCLFHSDLPLALHERGGWINRDSAGWFADYAVLVAKRYGDRVKHFATINEPSIFTLFGYALYPAVPGFPNRAANLQAIHHVNLAHGSAVDVLRALVPGASIGCVHARQPVWPGSDAPEDRKAAEVFDEHWNLCFPDPQILGHYPPNIGREIEPYVQAGDLAKICRPVDWFGFNHYSVVHAKANPDTVWGFGFADPPVKLPATEIGWSICPEAFRAELLRVSKSYRLPIYVTENGCGSDKDAPGADGEVDDRHRIEYLTAYIGAMQEAIAEGADVRGYFVWSLLDNFEWSAGYASRFGLVYVDYATQRRIPKASAKWYSQLIGGAKD